MKNVHCLKCGHFTKKVGKNVYICIHCDYHYYDNPRPTNAVILENEKGEILLVKRAYPPKKAYWDLPGGFIEFNESFEEAAEREIREELGVSISNLHYIASGYNLYLYKGIYYHTVCVTFACQLPKQVITPKDDVKSVRFFPKNSIPFKRIAFTAVKKGLEEYLFPFHEPKRSKETKKKR